MLGKFGRLNGWEPGVVQFLLLSLQSWDLAHGFIGSLPPFFPSYLQHICSLFGVPLPVCFD